MTRILNALALGAALAALFSLAAAQASDYSIAGTPIRCNSVTTTAADSAPVLFPQSGKHITVMLMSLANSGSSQTSVSLLDGDGGRVLWGPHVVPAGSDYNLGPYPFAQSSAGNAIYYSASDATTTLTVAMCGEVQK